MGIIATENADVSALRGWHLYHHGMSQCSQRVRICLEEKQVPWTSHVVNLLKAEHLKETYGSINPNNVVPTLVHDGRVIIESTDIIQYIDEHFTGPSFTPASAEDKERMAHWLEQSNVLKPAIRVLSHQFLFKMVAKKSAKELADMKSTVTNQDLIRFHTKFSSRRGLEKETVTESICAFDAVFKTMDQALSEHLWLAGDSFSLADISWMGDVHRVMLMKFPLQQYPYLRDWIKRLQARPSYQKALLDYQPTLIKFFFSFFYGLISMRGRNLSQVAVPC